MAKIPSKFLCHFYEKILEANETKIVNSDIADYLLSSCAFCVFFLIWEMYENKRKTRNPNRCFSQSKNYNSFLIWD